MGDRSMHSRGLLSQKSLFCFFTITTLLFIFSWFFFLRSTGRPHFIDRLPNPRIFPSHAQNNVHLSTIKPSSFMDDDEESGDQEFKKCNPNKAILKVFMYDLPPEFHFGMLDWRGEGGKVWPDLHSQFPDYPGGLNLQHSIEYWLTLDLLSSRFSDRRGSCSAIKVDNSSEADVIFVPFFSSLSYNRFSKVNPPEKASKNMNKLLQEKLVAFLMDQKEWKRSGGRDHVIIAHHPNSMLDARTTLWPAILILADLGRYPPIIANVGKDVIAPYKHIIKTFVNDSSGYDNRPTLLYFQGAIYRKDGGFVRQELFYLLKDEKGVHFSFGTVLRNGINEASQGMHSSKFCLNIAGDTPSSNRLFDAIASHCVPVIVSDEIELPYEDVLDYSKFCIFVRTSDALKEGFLIQVIRSIGREEWTRMWERLKEVEHYFEYQYPSQKDDAVQMIWQAMARKVPAVRLMVNKFRRFARSDIGNVRQLTPISGWEKTAARLNIPTSRQFDWSGNRNKKQLEPTPKSE
ncbi:putative arabinosyltransferase ARAD1 [Tasmannia lanceolata]|uniref:putative arabinosyltransferase ARAD1 n=1 Tax=Tasmannia lanceolata TaxID=3420 RepID=UPI00406396AF